MDNSFIAFHTENIDFILQNEENISQWLKSVAGEEQKTLNGIDYIFCSDDYLLEMNRTFLQHDYYTDVISFPIKSDPIEANVFISIDRVRENAQIYKQSFDDELHRVILHGLLHMIGYNDKSPEDEEKIRHKENYYLEKRAFI